MKNQKLLLLFHSSRRICTWSWSSFTTVKSGHGKNFFFFFFFSTQPKQMEERCRNQAVRGLFRRSWHRSAGIMASSEMMKDLQRVKLWAVLTRRERKCQKERLQVKTRDERRKAVTERCPSEDTLSMFGCWALAVLFGRCVPAILFMDLHQWFIRLLRSGKIVLILIGSELHSCFSFD